MVTLGLDGSQYESKFGGIVKTTEAGHQRMGQSMGVMKRGALELAAAEDVKTAAIEGEAAAVGASTIIHNALNQTLNQTAVQVGSVAVTNIRVTNSTRAAGSAAAAAGSQWAKVLIILRDIARGQWARAFSTLTTLLQGLGIGAGTLIAVFASFGFALYAIVSSISGAAKAAQELAAKLFFVETKLRSQIEAVRSVREEYQRLRDEMARKNDDAIANENSITKAAEDTVAAMHKEFVLREKMAKLAGQTPQESARKTQEEARQEAQVYKDAEIRAKFELAGAKAKERASLSKENEDKMAQAEATLKTVKAAAELREKQYVEAKTGNKGTLLPKWLGGEGFHPLIALANIPNDQENLTARLLRKAGYKGGEIVQTSTGAQTTVAVQKEMSEAAERGLAAQEAIVEALKKSRDDTARERDKAQRDYDAAKEKARASKESAEALAEVDTDVKKKQKEHREGPLTDLQRHGFNLTPGVSLVDLNKRTASAAEKILQHLQRQNGGGYNGTTRVGTPSAY